jgi:Tol biopolymer transport system component
LQHLKVSKAEASKAVEQLVEQLRRYPARPSTAAGQIGLFLIEAEGGTATLIANEPDPWLIQCGSPAWSHDGTRILFDAMSKAPPRPDGWLPIARVKALDLADGRLEIKDLRPGNWPDSSPSDDRVIFLLKPGSAPGVASGVWLMRSDGAERRLLGGAGRPKWSPDSRQFMIIGPDEPCEVTIMDVRPDKSGVLRIADKNVFSVPSWAGESTIVAVIGSEAGDSIALVDVSDPQAGKVKDILWKQGSGLNVRPSFPIFSPATGRCVFVGSEDGKGSALYGFVHSPATTPSAPQPPKRLEQRGLDKVIQDLTFSPDGRYVVFASDRREAGPTDGHRPQSVDAPALSGITIDGDLKDWPAAMPRYPIQNMVGFSEMTGIARHEHAFLTTSADMSASFSVGYDPKEQLIYVAVIVRDDQLIAGNTSVWDTDAVEIYVDGLHSDTTRGLPQNLDWLETLDASEAPVLQYVGIPGKGPVYGVKKSAGVERSGEDNPILTMGDIKKTRTRMAFRREGDVTIYEWAVQAFDHYPDKPTKLLPGMQIGFDVAVIDKDKPPQTPLAQNDPEIDRQSWLCWGPPWRLQKFFDAANLGEIVLGRIPGR